MAGTFWKGGASIDHSRYGDRYAGKMNLAEVVVVRFITHLRNVYMLDIRTGNAILRK